MGAVKLIEAEWVPSRCGVVVDALLEGCEGNVHAHGVRHIESVGF